MSKQKTHNYTISMRPDLRRQIDRYLINHRGGMSFSAFIVDSAVEKLKPLSLWPVPASAGAQEGPTRGPKEQ